MPVNSILGLSEDRIITDHSEFSLFLIVNNVWMMEEEIEWLVKGGKKPLRSANELRNRCYV